MKNTVDNLSKSKVILMCGPAGAGKSTLAKKFESTGMTILSYDEESFKRGFNEHPLPQEVLEDIKTYLDEKLISLIMQNIDIVLDYSFWSNNIGILGFSQGARVMAELLKEVHSIKFAISWSGACHDGIGVFKGWFDEYYQEALENGYAKIPMFWRENLLLSKKWFDDIRDTTPMMGLRMYEGPILAIAGDKDELVPYYHAKEIVENSKNENSKTVIVKNSNHTFNVLMPNESKANDVIEQTIQWINKVLII